MLQAILLVIFTSPIPVIVLCVSLIHQEYSLITLEQELAEALTLDLLIFVQSLGLLIVFLLILPGMYTSRKAN